MDSVGATLRQAENLTPAVVVVVGLTGAVLVALQAFGVPIAALMLLGGSFLLPDSRARTVMFSFGCAFAVVSLAGLVLVGVLV